MTKAQQVRNRRSEKLHDDLIEDVEKIFDWILDLIDSCTKIGYFGPVEIYLYHDEEKIRHYCKDEPDYNLFDVLLKHDRQDIFRMLKKVIDQEEGYSATLQPHVIYYDRAAIFLKIVIK